MGDNLFQFKTVNLGQKNVLVLDSVTVTEEVSDEPRNTSGLLVTRLLRPAACVDNDFHYLDWNLATL